MLEAIRHTNGFAGYASDKKMLTFARFIRDREGLNVVPASTAGLIALVEDLKPMTLEEIYHKKY